MNELTIADVEKHCNTCGHAYERMERRSIFSRPIPRQHCGSIEYNSPAYTYEMMSEGLKKGYCRFWQPKK